MTSWMQGIAVAGLGVGLMSGVAHGQEAEQVAQPAPLLVAANTSDDFTVQSFGGRSVLPVKVRNCWYFTYTYTPPRGPDSKLVDPSFLVVERLPMGGCQPRSRVLAETYNASTLLAVTHAGDELVIAYSIKPWYDRYGPVRTSVKLFHLSTDTLENQRTVNNELSLGNPYGGGWPPGSVNASHLEFVGQDLVVHGYKTGPIISGTPEEGSGPYFKATFNDFLRGTTPPSILASGSPTTELGAEELRAIEARQVDPVEYESPFTAAYSRFMPPFRVQNCWYVMHQRWNWYMSPNSLFVDRLPVNGCSAGRLSLGTSWYAHRFLVAVKQGQLALAWTSAASPYWPTIALQLAHVEARTLTSVRSANTRLTAISGWGWGGEVTPEQLSFEGQRLVVRGTKTGPLQEVQESGSGSNFTATFERFLSSDAPPSVVAY